MTPGKRFRLYRLLAGATVRAVSQATGLTWRRLVHLEADKDQPTPAEAELFASFYDIPTEALFSGPIIPPASYGPYLTLEDDSEEDALTVRDAYERLWRWQMAEDKPWQELSSRLSLRIPPPPLPFTRFFITPEGTDLWLNYPYSVSAWSHAVVLLAKPYGRGRERIGHKLTLPPGKWRISSPTDTWARFVLLYGCDDANRG